MDRLATRLPSLARWLGVLLLMILAMPAWPQQLEEEDLPEPALWDDVVNQYVEAEKVFNSRNQSDSVALFDAFLADVAETSALEEPPAEIHQLVANSYYYRAQVNFNMGESEVVDSDLRELLTLEPGFAIPDRTLVSPKFIEAFDRLKKELVAQVIVTVDPPDAKVTVGRWQADPSGLLLVPAGHHTVTVERAGYSTVETDVEASTSKTANVDVVLERVAAVLTVYTVEEGVEISIDGAIRGTTEKPSADPSAVPTLVLDDLQPGIFELSAQKEGFREYLANAEITDLQDFSLGPIELVPTSGEVLLAGLPAGTVVRANGQIVTPVFGGPAPTLKLSPGEYRIALSHPDRGLYETDVVVEDQASVQVDVRLRPPLVLLGILGGDTSTASRLGTMLSERFDKLDQWAPIDRSGAGTAILEAAGVDLGNLRAFAQTGSRQVIPWERIQAEADKRADGALYVLGVLSDDLLANQIHMFLFPQAPLPPHPDLVNLTLDAATVDHLGAMLDASVLVERPALGAILIDSPAARGPLVIRISPGGAARLAGLEPGDEIVAIDGTPVSDSPQLQAEMAARIESHARTGKTVPLRVVSAAGEREAQLGLVLTPVVIRLGATDLLYSAASYELANEEADAESLVPKWVVQLNEAIVYLHGGDLQGAIQRLRSIAAPPGEPLGEAEINYLLGLALSSAGGEYAQTASGFLTKAAEMEDGRLYHADGPLIAPRAQIRLQSLN